MRSQSVLSYYFYHYHNHRKKNVNDKLQNEEESCLSPTPRLPFLRTEILGSYPPDDVRLFTSGLPDSFTTRKADGGVGGQRGLPSV